MGAAPRDRQGVAAGVLATGRVVGQSLSVALAGALFGVFGGAEATRALRQGSLSGGAALAFVHGTHAAFVGCAIVALASSMVALVRGRESVTQPRPFGVLGCSRCSRDASRSSRWGSPSRR